MQTKMLNDNSNDIKHSQRTYSVLNVLHTYINSFNSHNNPMVCVLITVSLWMTDRIVAEVW